MKKTLLALIALAAMLAPAAHAQLELGLQAYTFRKITFAETLDRAAAMNIKYIQAYPGQKLSPANSVNTHHSMDAAAKAEMRALLKAKGVTLTSYGVVSAKNEAEWTQIFDFAKEMGMRDIAIETNNDQHLATVKKLSEKTGVLVTLHNHARPPFGNPDDALAVVNKYGKNFGLCADTGHWARAGLDPVATLKKTKGKMHSIHFKDISERGTGPGPKPAHDMPWGSGSSDPAQQIAELRRQNFKGIAYMEYEIDVPQARLDAETAASADWFQRAVAAPMADLIAGRVLPAGFVNEQDISKTWSDKKRNAASERWSAAKPLFNNKLTNATYKPGSWEYKDGVLTAKGGGDIWSKETFGNFVLNLDFRCEKKTNSGVFLRCTDIVNWLNTAIEVQILQGDSENDKHLVGGIFDISAPSRQVDIKPGQWYHFTITAKGQNIKVSIDGEEVTNVDLSKWKEAGKNPDGTANKFTTPYAEMAKKGHIGLQYHDTPVSFRNIVIERIE